MLTAYSDTTRNLNYHIDYLKIMAKKNAQDEFTSPKAGPTIVKKQDFLRAEKNLSTSSNELTQSTKKKVEVLPLPKKVTQTKSKQV